MEFEADPIKTSQNLKKHKVSFEEAASIFGDPMAYMMRLLAVIYTEQRGKIRLVSARLATKQERKIYEED